MKCHIICLLSSLSEPGWGSSWWESWGSRWCTSWGWTWRGLDNKMECDVGTSGQWFWANDWDGDYRSLFRRWRKRYLCEENGLGWTPCFTWWNCMQRPCNTQACITKHHRQEGTWSAYPHQDQVILQLWLSLNNESLQVTGSIMILWLTVQKL